MTHGENEFDDLLRNAGLEVLGTVDMFGEHGLRPPATARRAVRAHAGEGALKDPHGTTGPTDHWRQLATEHGIVGSDGEFLLSVTPEPRKRNPYDLWRKVRPTDRWDVRELLVPGSGYPEFVAMSPDGETLIGVRRAVGDTEGTGAVRFTAVPRLTAWLEASAEARAASGSRQDTAEVWASVPRPEPDPERRARLASAWRDGLASHTAAPAAVLRRLLAPGPKGRVPYPMKHRDLPEDVVEAWIEHPDWQVRRELAERWKLTAEQRDRLLLDPEPRRRWYFLANTVDDRAPLTDTTFARLAADPSPQIRAEVARHRALPPALATALAADPEPGIRAGVALHAWEHLDGATRKALLADPEPAVRAEAVLRHHDNVPLTPADFTTLPGKHREEAAEHCRLSRELAKTLVHGPDDRLRGRVASNPGLDPDLVAVLARHPDTRWQVSLRPELTEEERSRIPVEVDPGVYHYPLNWVLSLQHDEEAIRRCARSTHLLVRRSAARAKTLPQDVADLLARDEDRVVRLLLAEHCAQAPAEVLLEMRQTWNGYSAARMPLHPNFPRENLLRFADHDSPALRELAPDDPASTAELVERLSRDEAPRVRRRALRDPRLSPASVILLLDDPDPHIRAAAASDGRLPAALLAELLHAPATAEHAATNPTLPKAVMHRLLDAAPAEESC
ncbi:PE-PGRS family protein [Streptomyces sp. I05A-00742]|uniref:PE-PGRS family protein n=1 Tax=Streptomyces sp. I05A-00742 TaxID=2732853 RepID=UPI001488BCF1|nr:PE-PGRS family protein [Streptomyces sp. I05A-00742]